ncbi:hypothetical protein GCM10020331_052420 [Ectobacillus funiculus]
MQDGTKAAVVRVRNSETAAVRETVGEAARRKTPSRLSSLKKVHIDKIVFDKFELNNNFGQLGIKELKGRLNIGATYGNDFFYDRRQRKKRNRNKKG